MILAKTKTKIFFVIFISFSSLILSPGDSKACWRGALESIKVGDSINSMFGKHRKVAYCGGEFVGARHGQGYVFCAYPEARVGDKQGRRLLIVNGTVVDARDSGGDRDSCSWDANN